MLKVLVIFDSYFGSTEKIGRVLEKVIPDAIGVRASEVSPSDIRHFDLIIVGSPTRGFRPTRYLTEFISNVKPHHINGKMIMAFDTRNDPSAINPGFLRILASMTGHAASVIQKQLFRKGGKPVIAPEGFLVESHDGPLLEGQLEKAAKWGKEITEVCREIVSERA